MSRSDREHHWNYVAYQSCKRKVRYKTQHDANRARKQAVEKRPHQKLSMYFCEYCKGWHLCKVENKFNYDNRADYEQDNC